MRVGRKFDYVFSIVWVGFKQDRNTAFDAPDARGIMVYMRSGRTDYNRGMNPGTVRKRARSEKFFSFSASRIDLLANCK